MIKEKTQKPERRNRFDKTVDIELSVSEIENNSINTQPQSDSQPTNSIDNLDSQNNNSSIEQNSSKQTEEGKPSNNTDNIDEASPQQEEAPIEQSEQVPTVETTTIVDGEVQNNTQIVSTYTALTNLKSNDVISKIVKKGKEEDKLAEFLANFPNKNKNEIVALFIDEILKQKEKDIRRQMLGFKTKKTKKFKESKETFSMPVRPEMKLLLDNISLFSEGNKYLFFEEFILHACKTFDFEAEHDEFDE